MGSGESGARETLARIAHTPGEERHAHTFMVGLYGMNFKYMPELEQRWGYPAVLGVMALTAVGMLIYFRRKQWI